MVKVSLGPSKSLRRIAIFLMFCLSARRLDAPSLSLPVQQAISHPPLGQSTIVRSRSTPCPVLSDQYRGIGWLVIVQ